MFNESTTSRSLESEVAKILAERKTPRGTDGRCSATQAECLMTLRESKLYQGRCATWDEFCPKYLGLTKAFANRAIRALEEFGPAYFDVAELIRITPEEFRSVAPRIKDKVLHLNGEALPLILENAARISAEVQKLHGTSVRPTKPYASPTKMIRMTMLERQCTELIAEFRKLTGPLAPEVDQSQLASVLSRTLGKLGRIELEMGLY